MTVQHPDERLLMEFSDEALMNELSRRIAVRRTDGADDL